MLAVMVSPIMGQPFGSPLSQDRTECIPTTSQMETDVMVFVISWK